MPEGGKPTEEDLERMSVIVPLHVSFNSRLAGKTVEMDLSFNLTRYKLNSAVEISKDLVLEDLKRPEVAGGIKPEKPVEFVVTGNLHPSIGGATKRWLSSAYSKEK